MSFPDKSDIEIEDFLDSYASEIQKGFECIDPEELEKIANVINYSLDFQWGGETLTR